jgi:hypothetical protein
MPDIEDLTDKNLALSDEDTDVGIDTSLLDVTGQTHERGPVCRYRERRRYIIV